MKLIFITVSLLLVTASVLARPVTFENGVAETVTISVTVTPLIEVSPEICAAEPETMGCENVVLTTEDPKHYCEDHPEAVAVSITRRKNNVSPSCGNVSPNYNSSNGL